MTEASPEDLQEQAATPGRDAPLAPSPDVPAEADPSDVAEQSAPVAPGEHPLSGDLRADRDLPLEADPADAAEQAVVVEDDEDEHR